MSPKKPRRVLKVVLTLLTVGIVILGIRAWQVVAPVLGWSIPSFDTEAPLLPPNLEDAPLAVLHFSRTAGFRHEEAIPAAAASLDRRCNGNQRLDEHVAGTVVGRSAASVLPPRRKLLQLNEQRAAFAAAAAVLAQ